MSRSIKAVYEDYIDWDYIDRDYVAYCKKLVSENPNILSLDETRALLRVPKDPSPKP